jgi:Fe-S-cluster containining protein
LNAALRNRLEALAQIYEIYDRALASFDLACRQGCDHCCTANVTLTSLEARRIIEGLGDRADEILAQLQARPDSRRFRPVVTINAIAAMTLAGEEPPEESAQAGAGACPLLVEGRCPIYSLRPFACRCMVSTRPCEAAGYATVDDFLVTVNTVFQQVIEQLDADGCTGNLRDVLCGLGRSGGGVALDCERLGLAANRPMPALMVPPEHRGRIAALLDQLRCVSLGGADQR